MSKVMHQVNELEKAYALLKSVGEALVEMLPEGDTFALVAAEVSAAAEGVQALKEHLEGLVQEAEQAEALKQDISEKLETSPHFSKLSKKAKAQISEKLLQDKQPVPDQDSLTRELAAHLDGMAESELLAMFSKKEMLEIGREIDPEAEDVDAFAKAGKYLRDQLTGSETRRDLLQDLAASLLEDSPETYVKKLYGVESAFDPGTVLGDYL